MVIAINKLEISSVEKDTDWHSDFTTYVLYFVFHLKEKYNEYVTIIHKKEYSECNLPWTLMDKDLMNTNSKFRTKTSCNLKSIYNQSRLNMKFFDKASKYEIPGCKGNFQFFVSFFAMIDP